MSLKKIVETLDLKVWNEGDHLDTTVSTGYVGDLLSDVISSGRKGDIWITIQVHENIIAVASLKELAGIILSKNSTPLNETLEKAKREGVTLLGTPLTSYQIVARLAELGIHGTR